MGFSVFEQVGLRPGMSATSVGVAPSVERLAVEDSAEMAWYSPRNPLVWLGGIMAVTVGLASVAGSVRVGKAKVSASVGKASS